MLSFLIQASGYRTQLRCFQWFKLGAHLFIPMTGPRVKPRQLPLADRCEMRTVMVSAVPLRSWWISLPLSWFALYINPERIATFWLCVTYFHLSSSISHGLVLDRQPLCSRFHPAGLFFVNPASSYYHCARRCADQRVRSIHPLREHGILQSIHDDQLDLWR